MSDARTPGRDRWNTAWRELGLEPPADLFDTILTRYAESYRAYHNLQHLADCLTHLDAARIRGVRRARIELALWFHDVVYEPRRSDNEQRSARWAHRALLAAGADRPLANAVRDLVLATTHAAQPTDDDARLIVDIDLAILGANENRYREYEEQIRREYGWVPGFVFRRTRKRILQGFLDRPAIYTTPALHETLEARARANLTRAIDALGRARASEGHPVRR